MRKKGNKILQILFAALLFQSSAFAIECSFFWKSQPKAESSIPTEAQRLSEQTGKAVSAIKLQDSTKNSSVTFFEHSSADRPGFYNIKTTDAAFAARELAKRIETQGTREDLESLIRETITLAQKSGATFSIQAHEFLGSQTVFLHLDLPENRNGMLLTPVRLPEIPRSEAPVLSRRIEIRLRAGEDIAVLTGTNEGHVAGDSLIVDDRTSHGLGLTTKFENEYSIIKASMPSKFLMADDAKEVYKIMLKTMVSVLYVVRPRKGITLKTMDKTFIYGGSHVGWIGN